MLLFYYFTDVPAWNVYSIEVLDTGNQAHTPWGRVGGRIRKTFWSGSVTNY